MPITLFTRPIFTIARMLLTPIFRRFLPVALSGVVPVVIGMMNTVLTRFGAFTLVSVMRTLFMLFIRNLPMNVTNINRYLRNVFPEIPLLIIETLGGFWVNILKHKFVMSIFSIIMFFVGWIAIIRPMVILRIFFGGILASIGVMWNISLNTIEPLYNAASQVYKWCEDYGINLPIPEEVKDESSFSKIMIYLSILLLGMFGIACVAIMIENATEFGMPATPQDMVRDTWILKWTSECYTIFNNLLYQIPGMSTVYDYVLTPLKNNAVVPTLWMSYNWVLKPTWIYIFNPTLQPFKWVANKYLFNSAQHPDPDYPGFGPGAVIFDAEYQDVQVPNIYDDEDNIRRLAEMPGDVTPRGLRPLQLPIEIAGRAIGRSLSGVDSTIPVGMMTVNNTFNPFSDI